MLAVLPLLLLAGASPAAAQAHAYNAGFSLSTLLAIGALSLLPLLLMTATSFAKIAVVLSLLRNAFGVQDVPSGAIVTALAAILSVYVMAPVADDMLQRAAPASARIDYDDPLAGESKTAVYEALSLGAAPLSAFLVRNSGAAERALFVELTRKARPADAPKADSLIVALPAFLITELKEAFQVGLLVLLPFVVIDLVVASILVALGMSMLAPGVIALPAKLLLFVLIDGWYVLSQALVAGYR
jgi:type III secretion protein R